MFSVQHANHLVFFNKKKNRGGNRGRRSHSNRLPCHAPLTKKVARSQNGDDRLFANLIDNRELYTAFLNVHHSRSGITLRVDLLGPSIFHNSSGYTGRIEKSLGIESELLLEFYIGFD